MENNGGIVVAININDSWLEWKDGHFFLIRWGLLVDGDFPFFEKSKIYAEAHKTSRSVPILQHCLNQGHSTSFAGN